MTFNKCSIDGKAYGDVDVDVSKIITTNYKNFCLKNTTTVIKYTSVFILKLLNASLPESSESGLFSEQILYKRF